MPYIVETDTLCQGWVNCWMDDKGNPTTFETLEDAENEIRDHIIDCINAVEGGDMQDSPDPSDFRITKI